MNYYFKLEIISGWGNRYIEIREIEFYLNNYKIPVSSLKVIHYSSQYNTTDWSANNIIDSVINDINGWCTADFRIAGEYIIIKSTEKFNKIVIYNDAQGIYAVKECKIYICNSDFDPQVNDANWRLAGQKLVTLGTNYPSGLSVQIEYINKYLIKQGDNYYSIQNNTLTELGIPADDAQKEQWFDDYGVDDLKGALLTPDENGNKLIDDLDDQFEIRMMKAK